MSKKRLWFKAKQYGWGWYPCSWQGWAVTFGFVSLVVANSYRLNLNSQSSNSASVSFFFETLVIVLVLILICYKTGEKPGWRWGGKKSR